MEFNWGVGHLFGGLRNSSVLNVHPLIIWVVHLLVYIYIYFCKCQKANEKKSKEDKQTLEELNSAHSHSQTKCQWVQTSYIKQSELLSFLPYNKHLINLIKSVYICIWRIWEILDLGCVFRPHCIRSVLTTSVKILPYRPPAQLIRAM